MRTSTWFASISIILNLALGVLLADKLNQKSAPSTVFKTTKEPAMDVTAGNHMKTAAQNEEPVAAVRNIDFGPVVAVINDTKVRQLELLPYISEVIPAGQIRQYESFNAIPEEYLKSAIDSYAIDLLFMDIANEKGITDGSRLQAVISRNKRRIIRTAYLSAISATLVSEEQVKEKYDKLTKSLKDKQEYRARHILLASEKEASIISRALIEKERSFDELAKLFSLDDSTGFKGGDLGYHVLGQLNPEFEQAISNIEINIYTKPFKTELGWHIAIVDDRRDAIIMPYEKAAPVIRKSLQQQAVNTLTERLVKKARIILLEH